MGKLESITTLATLAVGGLVFLKVYPLFEGFLKGGSDLLGGGFGGGGTGLADFGQSLIPQLERPPLRTFNPVPDVRYNLTENTAVIPNTDFPVSPQRLAYQENIGVPILTDDEYQVRKAAWHAEQMPVPGPVLTPAAPPIPIVQKFYSGETSMSDLMKQLAQRNTAQSGQFWINPLTQENMGAYVAGHTPQAVLDLRAEDIFPAVRGL